MSKPLNTPLFFLGLGLGQVHDYTGLTLTERTSPAPSHNGPLSEYWCQKIKRVRGMSYPAIMAHVGEILNQPELKGKTELVVDGTGVGSGVVDLIRDAGLNPIAMTITNGLSVTHDSGFVRVPKVELAGIMQVLLQGGRLKIEKNEPDAQVLQSELVNFKPKVSSAANSNSSVANDWREGAHDDLVLSLSIAVWRAEWLAKIARRPPSPPSRTSNKIHG